MEINQRFLQACRREPVDVTPVWFMRQAGRYMPEYRKIREKHTLLEICKTPEIATEVTMQPLKLGFDAAFEFAKGEGPVIHEPITSRAQIDKLRVIQPDEGLGYVLDSLKMIRKELNGRVPLIGFAGAPFTLASYLLEGGKSVHFVKTKKIMNTETAAWNL